VDKQARRFNYSKEWTAGGPGFDPLSLGPVVLAPDVEHEHAGNEEQGHHQNWHWPHLGT
jgi:hypothetical protein